MIEIVKPEPQGIWRFREHDNSVCLAPDNWLECVSGRKDHRRCVSLTPWIENKVVAGYRSLIYKHLLGQDTPVLKFKCLAIGNGNSTTTNTMTQLELEIYRSIFTDLYETSDNWIQTTTAITSMDANATYFQVLNVVNLSTLELSGSGVDTILPGTMLRIRCPLQYHYAIVDSTDGLGTVYLKSSLPETPLSVIAAGGSGALAAEVVTCWGELSLFMGTADVNTANSGTMVNRVTLSQGYVKSIANALSVEARFRENLG